MTKTTERAAVRRLIDQLGADIILSRNQPFPRERRERLSHRLAVDDSIEACQGCRLRQGCTIPLTPLWSPPSLGRAGRVAVVGEAPSYEEERSGSLGHGRAQSMMFAELRRAGVDPDHVTYLTSVACWPTDGPRSTRPPTLEEARTCAPNVMAALDAADVDYVILAGAWATRLWRGDLSLEKVSGGMFVWQSRWFVMPVQHVNAVLRTGATVEAKDWRVKIAKACARVLDGAGFESLNTRCIACHASMYGWDEDGVPWCDEHFDAGRGGRDKKARTKGNDPHQQQLGV